MAQRSRLWPDRRKKPPVGSVEINWGHPLALGLMGCVLFNEGAGVPQDLRSTFLGTFLDVPSWRAERPGIGLTFDGANDGVTFPNLTGNASDYSVVALAKGGITNFPMISSKNGYLELRFHSSSGQISFVDGFNGGTNATDSTDSSGAWHSYGGSQIGTALSVYRDGVAVATNTAGGAVSATAMGQSHAIGSRPSGSLSWSGPINHVYWYSRGLQPSEFAALSANPYAFLRETVRRRYFIPAGALSATVGQTTETDLAQPIARLKQKTLGQAVEADLAQAITPRKSITLGQSSETDTAGALSRLKLHALAQAIETEIAQALASKRKSQLLGQAVESDSALAMTSTGGAGGGAPGAGGYGILRVIRG